MSKHNKNQDANLQHTLEICESYFVKTNEMLMAPEIDRLKISAILEEGRGVMFDHITYLIKIQPSNEWSFLNIFNESSLIIVADTLAQYFGSCVGIDQTFNDV